MYGSDALVLAIVGSHDELMDSSDRQRMETFDWIIKEALTDLKGGYLDTYYYECEWPERPENIQVIDFSACKDTKNFNPYFMLLQPPDIKINPYTGKPMNKILVPFKGTAFSKEDFKKWVTQHVPNYSQNLITSEHAVEFRAEPDIAHLYLFSAKSTTPPIFSALTSQFNNRARFAFVQESAEIAHSLADELDIQKWPTLVIETQDKQRVVYSGKMKLPELVEWAAPFTLPKGSEKPELTIGDKRTNAMESQLFKLVTTFEDLNGKYLSQEEATLVYFTEEGADTPHMDILDDIALDLGDFINIVLFPTSKELFRKEYSGSLPQFRTYRNQVTGEKKKEGSFEILLPRSATLVKQTILDEVSYNFESDVKEVSEQIFFNLGGEYTRDESTPKHVVAYLYDDDQGANIQIKALSADKWLSRDFVFMAIAAPHNQLS